MVATVAYQRIPGSSAQADAVVADAEAADSVVVAAERANALSSQNVPDLVMLANRMGVRVAVSAHLALEIVITSKQ